MVKAAEGEWRPGPYTLDVGWLPAGTPLNFWQMGQNVRPYGAQSAMVEACVSAYAQTVAMCPGDHWRLKADGGRERITNSALCRILRFPNAYQSISDFLLNLTRNLYQHGEAFALAIRNDRAEIAELHLMRSRDCLAMVAEDGSVFYSLGGNEIVDRLIGQVMVPARDVLHVRLHTPRHPLVGESPILAARLALAAGDAALQRQIAFFANESKPSIMLATDNVITRDQALQMKESWDAQTRGGGIGGTPILSGGFKPIIVSNTAVDAQLAETLKMSDQSVALAMRVPLQVLGIGDTPYASTEMLMQTWLSSGLGFALNHIEEAIGLLFKLRGQPEEYVEFNTAALLRSSFKERIEAFAAGVKGGIFKRNEARGDFELPKVEGGDLIYAQQQDVPLALLAEGPPKPLALPKPADDEPSEAEAAKALLAMHKGFADGIRR